MAKEVNKLTDIGIKAAVTAAKRGEQTTKIRKLADGGSLYLWVYDDGRAYWRQRYWIGDKEKSISLGVYPEVSLADARRARDGYITGRGKEAKHVEGVRKLAQAGIDPSAERQARKRAAKVAALNSFESVAREWLDKRKDAWAPKHAADVQRRLETNLFPLLGGRPIDEIEPLEVLDALRKIEARGASDLAHRVLGVFGQVLTYAIGTHGVTRNWAPDLIGKLKTHVKRNQASIRPEEIPALLRAIDGYEKIGDRQTMLALQLLASTFVRTGELIGAQWSEFDLELAQWTVPTTRMKMGREHIVPLSRQALAILADLKKLSGRSQYVFPGRSLDKPISNNTMLFALYRLGFKDKMTGHGFRSLASTILNEVGYKPDTVEMQLAHWKNDVRGTYNKALYLGERRDMVQQWDDFLDLARSGVKVTRFMDQWREFLASINVEGRPVTPTMRQWEVFIESTKTQVLSCGAA